MNQWNQYCKAFVRCYRCCESVFVSFPLLRHIYGYGNESKSHCKQGWKRSPLIRSEKPGDVIQDHWQEGFDDNRVGYKKNHRDRQRRHGRQRSYLCVLKITDSSCWEKQFLFNKLLPPDRRNRQNITKPLKKSWKRGADVNPWSSAAFFFFNLLPVYPLFFMPLSDVTSGNTYGSAPRESRTHLQAYCHQNPKQTL